MQKYLLQVQEHFPVFKEQNSEFVISLWKLSEDSSENTFQTLSEPINSELLKPRLKTKAEIVN